ncbi:hypothetical protein RJ639_022627 [Escallonia herrerae]|uniref:Histone deacetylase domain-containing protein n=1 Tax=Escallonia herrerae TaxID=1293975 RepID=A0AA88UYQ7_9ASTE|nr:hypothetical protein RJ639_022627 [Escallonia herrerae]
MWTMVLFLHPLFFHPRPVPLSCVKDDGNYEEAELDGPNDEYEFDLKKKFDPNGRQCLTMEGYREIGQIVRSLADEQGNKRLLIVQEGGYHVTYSAYCLHAMLEGVLSLPFPLLSDPIAYYPEDEAFAYKVIESIKRFQESYVPFIKGVQS